MSQPNPNTFSESDFLKVSRDGVEMLIRPSNLNGTVFPLIPLSPTRDQIILPGFGCYVPGYYEIITTLEIASGAIFEIG